MLERQQSIKSWTSAAVTCAAPADANIIGVKLANRPTP